MSFFQEYLDDLVMEKVAYLSDLDLTGQTRTFDQKVRNALSNLVKSKEFKDADAPTRQKMYAATKKTALGGYTEMERGYKGLRGMGPPDNDTIEAIKKYEKMHNRANAIGDSARSARETAAYNARHEGGMFGKAKHLAGGIHSKLQGYGKYAPHAAYGTAAAGAVGGAAYLYNRNKKKRG